MSNALISFKNVNFGYSRRTIIENASFDIFKNECVSIVGPNGGGKTTILKLMLGLIKPLNGQIDVLNNKPEVGRASIGYMPQYSNYDENFPINVLDIVLMGRLNKGTLGFYKKFDKEYALDVLEQVGLQHKKDSLFSELSGGQKQRALIARALVGSPKILLLDEPTANLDYVIEGKFYELIHKLNETMTIVIVSHDIGFVANIVKRVLCVNKTVVEHPIDKLNGKNIGCLYGEEVGLVRHDLKKTGGNQCPF